MSVLIRRSVLLFSWHRRANFIPSIGYHTTKVCLGGTSSEEETTKEIYRAPAVTPPTLAQLQSVAARHHLNITNEDLEQYKERMVGVFAAYGQLEEFPEPGLPVKYPISPFRLPTKEQNTHGAWACFTDAKGAPDGKLKGKTVTVKDNIPMAGIPMVNGSQFMMGFVSAYHATVVSRILEAGGFIKGKSVCENFCFSGSSFTSSPAPVLNPIDKERVTGGSSSGTAALVALGEVDIGIGTDTGGSIRIPAGWCGIVGLKPTRGLVPFTGIMPIGGTLDTTGPLTRTVKDCALSLEALAGYDGGLDPLQPANVTVPKYTELLTGKIEGTRIALIKEGFEGSEPDVMKTVNQAAKKLHTIGATVEEISFPAHNDASVPALTIILEGAYHAYSNYGISPLASIGFMDTLTQDFRFNASNSPKADALPISLKNMILTAGYVKEKYGHHFYCKAINVVRDFVAKYDELFEKYDTLIMPTIKFKAPKHPSADLNVADYLEDSLAMVANTLTYNATGHPALSINAGFSDGLPVGMMIVGKHFDDATVMNVAYAFERLRDSK